MLGTKFTVFTSPFQAVEYFNAILPKSRQYRQIIMENVKLKKYFSSIFFRIW